LLKKIKKVFYNPKVKDKVTVLKTAEETNNEFILVEVELAPGGGTPKHYHTTFNETFIPIQGVLGVEVGRKQLLLQGTAIVMAKKK
jgi:quercetin dioxygenase-like cupin family protein